MGVPGLLWFRPFLKLDIFFCLTNVIGWIAVAVVINPDGAEAALDPDRARPEEPERYRISAFRIPVPPTQVSTVIPVVY